MCFTESSPADCSDNSIALRRLKGPHHSSCGLRGLFKKFERLMQKHV